MIQQLILAEDVYDQLDGGKRVTIRKGRRDIALGELLFESLEEKRQITVEVTRIIYAKLEDIPVEYLWLDGFESHAEMYVLMKRFYPDIEYDTECTVIQFEVNGTE